VREVIEPGFEPLQASAFADIVGPIVVRWLPVPVFRTVVPESCANTMGFAHGGYLSALIDIASGQGSRALLRAEGETRTVLTRRTEIDFRRRAAVGDAMDISLQLRDSANADERLCECILAVSDRVVASASVTFALR
jgi:acyl-coenzyme A thioesterase PaaI-like protein